MIDLLYQTVISITENEYSEFEHDPKEVKENVDDILSKINISEMVALDDDEKSFKEFITQELGPGVDITEKSYIYKFITIVAVMSIVREMREQDEEQLEDQAEDQAEEHAEA